MAQETVKLFGTIKTPLLRRVLFRGTALAFIGVSLLTAASTYLPENWLALLGLPILLSGAALIAIGLVPYRRLQRMEKKPSELIIDGAYLQHVALGKQQLSLPMDSVARIDYFEKDSEYGVALWLKEKGEGAVIVHAPRLDAASLLQKSRKKYGCDLFFPYFSRRAYTRLALYSPSDL